MKERFLIQLKQAEALRNRLSTHHKKVPEIESEIARRKAGFRGEQNVDYQLILFNQIPKTIRYLKISI